MFGQAMPKVDSSPVLRSFAGYAKLKNQETWYILFSCGLQLVRVLRVQREHMSFGDSGGDN